MLSSTPVTPPAHLPAKQLPTPRSILAGKVRSREEAALDEAGLSGDSSQPAKRAKVAFDPEVEVYVVEEWEKGLDLVREEVRLALERRKIGDNHGYDKLQKLFSAQSEMDEVPSATTLRTHILALLSNVSLLNRSFGGLVHSVLQMDWVGRDETFVALYIRLLSSLVSAQGTYLGPTLSMLLAKLVNIPQPEGTLMTISPRTLYARVHTAVRYILQYVPAASSALPAILSSTFPHSLDTKKSHTTYVRNLLSIVDYAPELKAYVSALIMERLVKIDVEVQVDMDELEDDMDDLVVAHNMSSDLNHVLDESSDGDSDNESIMSDESVDEEAQRVKILKSNVKKMDAVLDILFAYYDPRISDLNSEQSEQAFDLLLDHFANIVLPTYRSRHTQFLLFHFAQLSPFLIDKFAGACVHLALDDGRSPVLKQSAAAYLASFVSRGRHVPAETVRDVFDLLGSQLAQLRRESESLSDGPNLRRFGSFYAMVQALLYIFCFRWKDLLASSDDSFDEDEDPSVIDNQRFQWLPGVRDTFTHAIYSKLNPLKICSPSIVNEFARIAHHLQFMYVYPLLQSNQRFRAKQQDTTSARGPDLKRVGPAPLIVQTDNSNHLDAYFPFDPYQLPRSKRWIEGDYVEWQGIPGLDDQQHAVEGSDTEEDPEVLTAGVREEDDLDTDDD